MPEPTDPTTSLPATLWVPALAAELRPHSQIDPYWLAKDACAARRMVWADPTPAGMVADVMIAALGIVVHESQRPSDVYVLDLVVALTYLHINQLEQSVDPADFAQYYAQRVARFNLDVAFTYYRDNNDTPSVPTGKSDQ